MLLEQLADVVIAYWYLLVPALCIAYFLRQRYHNGLSKYPGPFLASFTDFWRAGDLLINRRFHDTCVDLHNTYGDVVRMGPNLLSFGDPRALKDIYGLNKGFVKVNSNATNTVMVLADLLAERILPSASGRQQRPGYVQSLFVYRRRLPRKVPSLREPCLLNEHPAFIRASR